MKLEPLERKSSDIRGSDVRGRRLSQRSLQGKKAKPDGKRQLPDYSVYVLSGFQRLMCIAAGAALFLGIGYLFYHQWIIAFLLSFGGLLVPRFWRKYMLERRRMALNLHFKQALYSLSSSLSAGRSVENGFREAIQDLRLLDPDAENDLITELSIICARMEYGEPIEDALHDFSRRACMEDITNFADVFTTCKRTGGDLVEVIRRTSSIIGEKLDIQQEIAVLVAQKKFESKALLAAPILMLVFMNLTSADYMKPMFSGMGMIISTFALLGLIGCLLWIIKMMNIKI
ncbi:type II secretion system F family protein [Paenibacillus dokdonensis]|uniref:Type II secretion system F family protein n=1 Tax=Paenibacillus dokdonensis TaxID=2567944 RepID=A0ABU6GJN2_9BACL|nr:type II secretion system F family protein [Paenibacillus dokdonensis]MEC0239408.1 type II secretion system F family protein [Paenibacillus dokdonensis]